MRQFRKLSLSQQRLKPQLCPSVTLLLQKRRFALSIGGPSDFGRDVSRLRSAAGKTEAKHFGLSRGGVNAIDNSAKFDEELGVAPIGKELDDPRSPADFPQVRVTGPKKHTESGPKKGTESGSKFNRAFIEKKHADYGWSPLNDRRAEDYYPEGNAQADDSFQRFISEPKTQKAEHFSEFRDDPYEKQTGVQSAITRWKKNAGYNPQDLSTFESFSYTARSATYRAALNVGLHWGKRKSLWHPSMFPYLRGVVRGRHVFDLQVTLAQLRRMIRLLQSLVMDDCNILFVCNGTNADLRTLAKIMCSRVDLPLLDVKYQPGSLANWDFMAAHYRGPGRLLTDGRKPSAKDWHKTKLHRMLQSPPDFIVVLNRKGNDILCHEANMCGIPVACLCDSDDSTRELQYVIACNTESIQSVHFVLDLLTRGIIEAQLKRDSMWYALKRDAKLQNAALKEAESEWQANYDPYEMKRAGQMLTGGEVDAATLGRIHTDFSKTKEEVVSSTNMNSVLVNMFGAASGPQRSQNDDVQSTASMENMLKTTLSEAEALKAEASRVKALSEVGIPETHVRLKQEGNLKPMEFGLTPEQIAFHTQGDDLAQNTARATDDFSLKMLQRHLRKRQS